MGPTDPPTPLIADAGLLIHLDELDCLDLLADFPVVLVPDQVWNQVQFHRPQALRGARCRLERCTAPPPTPELAALFKMFALDSGEQEAIAASRAHPEAFLLTDDVAARLAARALRLRAHGTIGILLRAIRTGHRTRAQVLDLLRQIHQSSSLHIQRSLLDGILEDVERQED